MTKTHLAARYLNRMKIPHYAKLHLMTALLYLIHECPGIQLNAESPVSIESFLEINESVRFARFVRFQ